MAPVPARSLNIGAPSLKLKGRRLKVTARRLELTAAAVAGALLLAACGGGANNAGGATSTSSGSTTTGTVATVIAPTTAPTTTTLPKISIGTIPLAQRSPAGTWGKAPTMVVPTTKPPGELEEADLIKGTGATAKDGDNVTVEYVLGLYSSHKVFQSSWTSQPFSFTVGQQGLILGWNYGMIGMKVGGRRELIIPPSLGYGASPPSGSGMPANDTLVFIIDLTKISA